MGFSTVVAEPTVDPDEPIDPDAPLEPDTPTVELEKIEPGKEYQFEIRRLATKNVKGAESTEPVTLIFDKAERPAPNPELFTLVDPTANPNGSGNYILSIIPNNGVEVPYLEEVLYRIDRESETSAEFGINSTNENCASQSEYKGEVKYAARGVWKESEAVEVGKKVTDIQQVAKPVISEGVEFRGTKEVRITCETPNVAIFYTIDGTEPDKKAKKYDETKPLVVGDSVAVGGTVTVKAKAYREDDSMLESEPAEPQTFTKTAEEDRTKVTLKSGIRDITQDMKDADYGTAESIEERFRQILAPFQFEGIEFYDMTVLRRVEGG